MDRDYLSSVIINVALIVSIFIVWTVILLPSHAAPQDQANVGHGVDIVSTASDPGRRGDRLVSDAHSKIGHGAHFDSKPVTKAVKKIPIGCELAFSKLANLRGVAARCITGVQTSVKLGLAAADYRSV